MKPEVNIQMKNIYLVPLLVIALIGAIFWGISRNPDNGDADGNANKDEPKLHKLQVGMDYYICPTLIEVTPSLKDGLPWDINGTGPDLECQISWKGNVVFTSGEKSDTLIASWSAVGADIASLILSGKMRLDSVIQAATIHVEPGGQITLQAWDNDIVSREDAGSILIQLETLSEGTNRIPVDGPGVRRVEILAVRKDQPEAKIIQQLISE